METIYMIVGDVVGREFPVIAKLSKEKQRKFLEEVKQTASQI